MTERLDPLIDVARAHGITLVSPGPLDAATQSPGFRTGALTRDPDGHGMRLIVP